MLLKMFLDLLGTEVQLVSTLNSRSYVDAFVVQVVFRGTEADSLMNWIDDLGTKKSLHFSYRTQQLKLS